MLTLDRPQPPREAGPTGNLSRSIIHGRDSVPPPRWARRCAWLAVLTSVPSGLWRMAMAVGIPVGASEEIRREHYGFPGWGTAYVFGLTFVLVGLALLTLGLVQRWGEVVPRWIPFVGARRVPPLAAVVPAGAGAVALTLLWVSTMSNVGTIWALYGWEGAERVLMMACYAPLLLWGPLIAAVTVSYHRRHRPGGRPGPPVTSQRQGRRQAAVFEALCRSAEEDRRSRPEYERPPPANGAVCGVGQCVKSSILTGSS